MPRITYVSDIHIELLKSADIEFLKKNIHPTTDILVLAGDIGNPFEDSYKDLLTFLSQKYKKVFVIAGNHEYYGNSFEETNDQLKKVVDTIAGVSFLCESYEDYMGIRWIGTTLWSAITIPSRTMYPTIRDFDPHLAHATSRRFLEETLDAYEGPAVVITHHIPSYRLIHPKYANAPKSVNQWFASDMDSLIQKHADKIKLWVYGHTHMESCQILDDKVVCVCNPVGYKGENASFNLNMVIGF